MRKLGFAPQALGLSLPKKFVSLPPVLSKLIQVCSRRSPNLFIFGPRLFAVSPACTMSSLGFRVSVSCLIASIPLCLASAPQNPQAVAGLGISE